MRGHRDRRSPVDLLATFAPFSTVPRRALAPLEPSVDVVHLPAGTVLARAGSAAHELAIVLAGRVAGVDPTSAADGGPAGGPGTIVGAAALRRDGRNPRTVVATTDVELLVVAGPACRWAAQTVLADAAA